MLAPITRRDLLRRATLGVGSVGLAALSAEDAAASPANPLAPKAPPLAARARRLVHLFMNGGPSQVDTSTPSRFSRNTTANRSWAEPANRAQDRGRAPIAIQVSALRQKRN